MGKDIKIFVAIIGITLLMVIGFSIWQGGEKETVSGTTRSLAEVSGVQASPENYDLGSVPIDEGNVVREYAITNQSEEKVVIEKLFTSCMCTRARISVGEKKSRFFGMERPGDRNPPLYYELAPGEQATVTIEFDPAAHGPQGVGPFDRVVTLIFSEPAGVKDLTFSGSVVR